MKNNDEPRFHRKANPKTQTIRVAVKQNRSGELWGKGAFGGLSAALAYFGELDQDQEGTEFTTAIPFAKNGDPVWAYWYVPDHGGDEKVRNVETDGESYACVDIKPTLNRYRCK